MVTDFSENHSIIAVWMRELRDVQIHNDRERFRRNLERIGQAMAYEISKQLSYKPVPINTPLAPATAQELAVQPVLATIFRAGLPMYYGMLSVFDRADSAFIGAYRKHTSATEFEVAQGYMACPSLEGRPLIIADPMLATGSSMVQAVESLLEYDQPSAIHVACIVATHEGVATVQRRFPQAHIWAAAVDSQLNAEKYIVPGLGDAGDLAFGEKRQH